MLILSVALSWGASGQFGLAGAAAGSVAALYFDRAVMLRRVSQQTGIAVSKLQDWRSLAWAFVSSVLAACAAWIVVENFIEAGGAFARSAIGGIVLLAAYAILNLRNCGENLFLTGSLVHGGAGATASRSRQPVASAATSAASPT